VPRQDPLHLTIFLVLPKLRHEEDNFHFFPPCGCHWPTGLIVSSFNTSNFSLGWLFDDCISLDFFFLSIKRMKKSYLLSRTSLLSVRFDSASFFFISLHFRSVLRFVPVDVLSPILSAFHEEDPFPRSEIVFGLAFHGNLFASL